MVYVYGSTPTNLNRKFVNNGTRVAQFRDTISSAIEQTCNIAFTPHKSWNNMVPSQS